MLLLVVFVKNVFLLDGPVIVTCGVLFMYPKTALLKHCKSHPFSVFNRRSDNAECILVTFVEQPSVLWQDECDDKWTGFNWSSITIKKLVSPRVSKMFSSSCAIFGHVFFIYVLSNVKFSWKPHNCKWTNFFLQFLVLVLMNCHCSMSFTTVLAVLNLLIIFCGWFIELKLLVI